MNECAKHRPKSRLLNLLWSVPVCVMLASAAGHAGGGYTESDIRQIYKILDQRGDGKVDRTEFDINKVAAIFYQDLTPGTEMTFEQTHMSRAFFDAADTNRDGKLSALEMIDALPFERVDRGNKGYITYEDLRRFLMEISR